MEQMNRSAEMYCLGCLCSGNEYKIQEYNIKYYDHFMAILNVTSLKLCYLCRAMAQHAELFVWNVHCNQIILENYLEDCTVSSCMKPESKGPPPIALSFSLGLVHSVHDNDTYNNHIGEGPFTHIVANTDRVIKTELPNNFSNILKELLKPERNSVISDDDSTTVSCEEVKQELDINDHSELDIDEDYDNDSPMKQENLPLVQSVQEDNMQNTDKSSPKEEEDNKTGLTMTDKKKLTTKEVLEAVEEKYYDDGVDIVQITLEQCMEERRLKALEPSYQARPYKCTDCVKGFAHRDTYEEHRRQWHGAAGGALVCSVCAVRLPSDKSLAAHTRQHTVRYRCRQCGQSGPYRASVEAHVQSQHHANVYYDCPHCHKRFKRLLSYKKHIKHIHQRTGRVICDLCNKSYASKKELYGHMVYKHAAAVGARPPRRERAYRCAQCPAAFTDAKQLRAHDRTHSDDKPYYCVECDKRYKTAGGLTLHLQTAPAHADKTNLPSCPQCQKRFTSERSRDYHIDAVHLDHRPHKCHLCDKNYARKSQLRKHVSTTHEGYKPPRNHLCNFCQQAFTTRAMLRAHIRRHTGERPFQCTDCDATFTQSGALYTHQRLKHKRLTKKEQRRNDKKQID